MAHHERSEETFLKKIADERVVEMRNGRQAVLRCLEQAGKENRDPLKALRRVLAFLEPVDPTCVLELALQAALVGAGGQTLAPAKLLGLTISLALFRGTPAAPQRGA